MSIRNVRDASREAERIRLEILKYFYPDLEIMTKTETAASFDRPANALDRPLLDLFHPMNIDAFGKPYKQSLMTQTHNSLVRFIAQQGFNTCISANEFIDHMTSTHGEHWYLSVPGLGQKGHAYFSDQASFLREQPVYIDLESMQNVA